MTVSSTAAIKGILKSWTIGGVITTRKHKVIFRIYSIFINVFVNFFFPCTLIMGWFESKDFQSAMENLSFQISITACSCKHFTIFFATKNIRKMVQLLEKLDLRAESKDEKQSLEYIASLCKRMYTAWICLYYLIVFLLELVKLWSGNHLIFPAWFPFGLATGSKAWIPCSYQILGMLLLTLESVNLDSSPTIFLMIMAVHIEVLGLRIKKIGHQPKSKPTENYDKLIGCIQDHRDVLQLFKEISEVIKGPMTVQLLLTAFAVCTEAANIMFYVTTFLDMFVRCFYGIAVILQIFPVCYFMNRVIQLNANLTGSIYQCNWSDQDLKFKKTLINFMQNTQRNLVMKAADITPIELSTFISIIQISFSMFTIISNLNT